jgi:hypothetical protein
VLERPRREDGDRDERLVAGRAQRGELRQRELGDVPLAMMREAEEDLLDREVQAREVDPSTATLPLTRSRTWS